MDCRGLKSKVKSLPLAPKQHNASNIIRLAGAETSSTSCDGAVAAATGRGFKSPPARFPRIAASVAVLAAASTGIPKKQAFGTNASTL